MSIPHLARLQPVPLREAWPHEAGSFTPWLAQCENLQLLGETIGMQLECEAQEQAVGPFSADILCRDLNTDKWVLIENQIERTDHTHLGQLLTYAAGLKAATVIWIASEFREEHRAALDWINEITTEDYNFIGIEVRVWRIGDSVPAPTFHIVSKPNNWSREMRDTVREAGELSEGRQLQREYWAARTEYLNSVDARRARQSSSSRHWTDYTLSKSENKFDAIASTWTYSSNSYCIGQIRSDLVRHGKNPADYFVQLKQLRTEVNAALSPKEII